MADYPVMEQNSKPEQSSGRKLNLWLAVLPAILIPLGMSAWSMLKFSGIQPALGISSEPDSKAKGCASVYGVNLYNSENYVREFSPNSGYASPKAPREFSTVVSGMVENTCDEPLQKVRISIKVRDTSGSRGYGEAIVKEIGPRQAKPFERAWIGSITSYEIAGIR